MNELFVKSLALPRKEREQLVKMLSQSLSQEDMAQRVRREFSTRYDELNEIMSLCIGQPLNPTRQDLQVWARAMIAYQLSLEGLSNVAIGALMSKAPCTILYLKSKISEMLEFPRAFKAEVELYHNFKSHIL